jgi:hypothetical protein
MVTMQIHQLQASYQADQDRILLRLNTHSGEEMRVWLTRRMLKGMIGHVQKLADHIQAMRRSAKEAAIDEDDIHSSDTGANDFETPFEFSAETALPLGETPLLTTALHVSPDADNSLRVRFEEVMDGNTEPGRSMEIALGPELLVGFVQVLDAVLKVADWGITLDSPLPPAPAQETQVNPLDDFANATRPKYLN